MNNKLITDYICKKGDINGKEYVERKIVIKEIIKLYKKIADKYAEKELYVDYINNDISVFIGIKKFMEKKKDKEGIILWDLLSQNTQTIEQVIKTLDEIPLYYLLSFLGYAQYRVIVG